MTPSAHRARQPLAARLACALAAAAGALLLIVAALARTLVDVPPPVGAPLARPLEVVEPPPPPPPPPLVAEDPPDPAPRARPRPALPPLELDPLAPPDALALPPADMPVDLAEVPLDVPSYRVADGVAAGPGGALDEPPQLLVVPDPALFYPRAARRRGIEGRTEVRVAVDAEGRVASVEILASEPPGVFEEAARRLCRSLRYRPATAGGEPRAATVNHTLRWELGR